MAAGASMGVESLSAAVLPSSVAAEHQDSHTTQQRHLTDPQQVLHYDAHDTSSAEAASSNATVSIQTDQSASNKRPASAMAEASGSVLVEFVAMMDQRFQELVGKMGEMIEVQKQLIDALQTSNPGGQAPSLALASAAEVVMKRRKKDSSSGDGSSDANNGFIL
ncbi:hypothetical protein PHYBOEH_006894 [Phytophthora boehmeriae]|uniref:Uncharacterized protein n=1 Tax=Phytophthora boehmeriae TaxID=109152 RepID=A0A8T1WC93_9STRA|nr:hypothetical protein PHYBOEH_006894 [Phytophthora boehmeriae]